MRPQSQDGHAALQNVPELWQLIMAGAADESTAPGFNRVITREAGSFRLAQHDRKVHVTLLLVIALNVLIRALLIYQFLSRD
jgi:hypothetical protein